jgi:GT2 family glycosyltransferase
MQASPNISVAICTNRPGQLKPAVESVLANPYLRHELVIVVQGGDWAAAHLAELATDPRVRIVNDPGWGVSRARNVALRTITGDIVLFTDDDCIVASDWVEQHLAVYDDHPEAALVFGRVLPPTNHAIEQGFVPTFDPAVEKGRLRSSGRVVLGMAANMSFRRSTVDRVGLFCEGLPCGEDTDYALRVAASGLVTLADSRPSVIHEGGTRPRGTDSRQLWQRDGFGFGAVTAKRAREGDWQGALRLVLFMSGLGGDAVAKLATRRSPSGARMAAAMIAGAVQGAVKTLRTTATT